MQIELITRTGTLTRNIPVSWDDVPVSLFADLQGKQGTELIAALLELEPEVIETLDEINYNFIADAIAFLDSDIPEIIPDFAEELNIDFESVGQLEKAKELLNLYPLWEAAPYIFAIYESKNYNEQQAFRNAIIYQKEPIQKIYSTVINIVEQINQFSERYLPLVSNEPDENEIAAGIDRFSKFGFFATLVTKCNGNPLLYSKMLKVPADVFYMTLYFEHEKNEYQKELQRIQQLTNAAIV